MIYYCSLIYRRTHAHAQTHTCVCLCVGPRSCVCVCVFVFNPKARILVEDVSEENARKSTTHRQEAAAISLPEMLFMFRALQMLFTLLGNTLLPSVSKTSKGIGIKGFWFCVQQVARRFLQHLVFCK